MADFIGSVGAGLAGFASTGFTNPLAGVVMFGVNLFASDAAENRQDKYDAQLAALAAEDKEKQQAAARITLASNEIQHNLDAFSVEKGRKQLSYRVTMAKAGITAFSEATGLSGSSVSRNAQGRITGQSGSALSASLTSELAGNKLFELAQGRIDVLSGIKTANEVLEELGLLTDAEISASLEEELAIGATNANTQSSSSSSSSSSSINEVNLGRFDEEDFTLDVVQQEATNDVFSIHDLLKQIGADAIAAAAASSGSSSKKDRESGSAGTLASQGTSVGSQSSANDVFGIGGV